jgi:hypothetical protein
MVSAVGSSDRAALYRRLYFTATITVVRLTARTDASTSSSPGRGSIGTTGIANGERSRKKIKEYLRPSPREDYTMDPATKVSME